MVLVMVFGTALLVAVLLSGLAARTVLSTSFLFLVGGALVSDGFLGRQLKAPGARPGPGHAARVRLHGARHPLPGGPGPGGVVPGGRGPRADRPGVRLGDRRTCRGPGQAASAAERGERHQRRARPPGRPRSDRRGRPDRGQRGRLRLHHRPGTRAGPGLRRPAAALRQRTGPLPAAGRGAHAAAAAATRDGHHPVRDLPSHARQPLPGGLLRGRGPRTHLTGGEGALRAARRGTGGAREVRGAAGSPVRHPAGRGGVHPRRRVHRLLDQRAQVHRRTDRPCLRRRGPGGYPGRTRWGRHRERSSATARRNRRT